MINGNFGIALVGYGGMGAQHVKLLKTTERIEVVGIYDIDSEKIEEANANRLNTYESREALLNDPLVDIVLIATPNQVHKEIAIDALNHGKNVICEKPVTLTTEDLQVMLDAAEKNQKLFVVHQNRRWDPDFQIMKHLYDNNDLGQVFNIEARVQGSRGIPGDWRKYKAYGGGMLFDWGVHLLDRLLWMTKAHKITSVYAQLSYVLGNDCDDGAKIYLNFDNGMRATVDVGTCNYESLPKWYMCGLEGTATVTDWMGKEGKLTVLKTHDDPDAKPIEAGAGLTKTMAPRDETTVNYKPLPYIDSDVRDFYRNVMDTIEGKSEIIVKNDEVMRCLKLIETCFKSAELNQVLAFEA